MDKLTALAKKHYLLPKLGVVVTEQKRLKMKS